MARRWTYHFGGGSAEGDPERKDVLGGKGASLAAMSRAGLPVPPGFTISVDCCCHYHQTGGWPEGLEEELRLGIEQLEKMTGRRFGSGREPLLVSVRSGAAVSMPGMMDTILNCGLHPGLAEETGDEERFWRVYGQFVQMFCKTVAGVPDQEFERLRESHGPDVSHEHLCRDCMELYERSAGRPFPADPWDALVECVNAVFRSWQSERAVVYRKSHDIRSVLGTAVNVQSMFPSRVSGVAFTENPARPGARELVIESSYGLGEAVVSGMVTPDRFVLDRDTLAIKERALGRKALAVAAIESDGSEAPADLSSASLTDEQIVELARMTLGVERHFGHPVDVEWGLFGGRFALLQSRAIRGLDIALDVEAGRRDEIARLKSLAGSRRKVWVVHNLSETLAAPTPLTWEVIGRFMSGRGGFGRLYTSLGYRPSARVMEEGFLDLICGRIYADPDRAAELFWGNSPFAYDPEDVLANPAVLESAPAKFDAERADGTFLLRAPGMLWSMILSSRRSARARTTALEAFEKEALPPFLAYVEAKRGMDLKGLSTDKVVAEFHERARRVLDEFGPESLKPGFFGGVARAALEARLVQLMGERAGKELCGVLTSGLEGDTTIEQNVALWRVASGEMPMDGFLRLYGHRAVGEMELAEPRWREDSAPLERMLGNLRRGGRSPEEMHRALVDKRRSAEESLPARLAESGGSSFREEVEALLREAQALLPYRESGKHYLMMGYALIRDAAVELARRWDLGRDVFFLRSEELGRFEAEREKLLPEIARRKVRWQSARRLDHPAVVDSADLEQLGLPRKLAAAEQLKAVALAPGIAEGTVRIVYSPDEAGDLGENCILVCPSTDPGWTALFVIIKGLVVERGGVLSHGAITARDFGIPAVACPDATKLLKEGSRVRVDGDSGEVSVVGKKPDA